MADLKFIGVNFPSVPQHRQADPATDRLLVNTIGPQGGVGGPLVVSPVAAVTGTDLVLDIRTGVVTVLTVNGNGTTSVTRPWTNGTDRSWANAISLDPSNAPGFGSDGSVQLVIGSGLSPATGSGTNGANNPATGSLMLQTDGSAWIKTGAGATSWTQLAAISDPTVISEGFDDFTENPAVSWSLGTDNNANISWGSNAAAYGFPGTGALALSVSTTAGSKIKALRFGSGLVLDTTVPVVVTHRVFPTASGVYSDDEFQWLVGIASDPDLTNGLVLFAAWDDGTSTRSYNIGRVIAGVPTFIPVVLPPLGLGDTSYSLRFTATATSYSVHYAIDNGPFILLDTAAVALNPSTYVPFIQVEKANGDGDRGLIIDWVSWRLARYADTVGAPTGDEFGDIGPLIGGNVGTNDNRITRSSGGGGQTIEGSSVTLDDSGNITGVAGLTASGTVQGNNVTATGALSGASASITNDITVGGTVDGRNVSVDGTKLDTIETGADVTDAVNVAAAGAVMSSVFNTGWPSTLFGTDGVGGHAAVRRAITVGTPTAAEDNTIGYAQGSTWIDTGTQSIWFCVDASTAAAIWVQLPSLTLASNIYNPTFTPSDGAITISYVDSFRWMRIGSIIQVSGLVEIATAGASAPDEIEITLPVTCGSSTIGFLSGSYTCQQDITLRGPIWGNVDGVSAKAYMRFVDTVAAGPYIVAVEFSYRTTS